MKKLIKSKATGAFLAPEGAWTADVVKAGEFSSAEAVRRLPIKVDPADCEIYYWFGKNTATQYDFTTCFC